MTDETIRRAWKGEPPPSDCELIPFLCLSAVYREYKKGTFGRDAAAAQIDPRTLRRYFDDPAFQRAYKEAFGGMVEDATRQAQQAIAPALATLREIVEDNEENAQARIQAARSTLEYALRLTEQLDILDRLTELEQQIGGNAP